MSTGALSFLTGGTKAYANKRARKKPVTGQTSPLQTTHGEAPVTGLPSWMTAPKAPTVTGSAKDSLNNRDNAGGIIQGAVKNSLSMLPGMSALGKKKTMPAAPQGLNTTEGVTSSSILTPEQKAAMIPETGLDSTREAQTSSVFKVPQRYDDDGNLVDEMGRRIDADGNIIESSVTDADDVDDTGLGIDTDDITRDDIESDEVDFSQTATSKAYKSALAELSGVAAGEGSAATNAAIAKGRQTLAAASKQAEARAGAYAQSTGALGQGTAGSLAQETRMNVLQQLAGQEISFAEMRGADQKEAIDKIISAEQAEKDDVIAAESIELQQSGQFLNMEQINRNFDHMDAGLLENIATRIQNGEQFDFARMDDINQFRISMELTEKQWEAEFGAEQGNNHMNYLLELSIDNPVLAKKIQSYLLTGATGDLGDFTEDEIAEMQRLKEKAEKAEGRVDNIYSKQLDLLDAQITSETQSASDELAGTTAQTTRINNFISSGDTSKMTTDDYVNMTSEQRADVKANATDWTSLGVTTDYGDGWDANDWNPDNLSDSEAKSRYAAKTPVDKGQTVNHGGTTYVITDPARVITTSGNNKRIATFAINTETGKEEKINESWEYE